MTDPISRAFAHPLERSLAMSGDAPLDRISVRDHVTEVEIGAFQSERGSLQRLRFNVVVEVAREAGPLDDDVDRILSYDRITEAIEAELSAERLNLLETLAERIALRILHEPRAARVFVRIEKLDRGPGALGVEIVRARGDAAETVEEGEGAGLSPRIVLLGAEAVGSPHLTAWLDRLERSDVPAILCVGLPDGPRPQTHSKLAQRRIDLLAIEQNAWVLAGRDRRCVVVNTATELDYAMKHRQLSVWAPSKLVLDAVEGPGAGASDAAALALWFARRMNARELVVIGGPIPDTGLPSDTTSATPSATGPAIRRHDPADPDL